LFWLFSRGGVCGSFWSTFCWFSSGSGVGSRVERSQSLG
jgi:hypothetical protein